MKNNKLSLNDNQLLLSSLQQALPLNKLKIQLLEEFSLENSVISSLNFYNSKINNSIFNKVKFLKCSFNVSCFIKNVFSDCLFVECHFNYTNFYDNRFTDSSLEMNFFQDDLFEKNFFSSLRINQSKFEDSLFENCQFTQGIISQSLFSNTLIQSTNLTETEFKETDFVKVDIEKSDFKQILFQNVFWNKSLLKNCSLENSNFILNTFKKIRLRENTGLPKEITELILKGKGSTKSFLTRCFENIYVKIICLLLVFNCIFVFMYISFSQHCYVPRSLFKELIFDNNYEYFMKNTNDLKIAFDLIIRPLESDEELILNEIFKKRQDPLFIEASSYVNSSLWIPNQSRTVYEGLNNYLKNEYLNFIPLWCSLLEKKSMMKRGYGFYTWLIDKTLSHDIPPPVYMKIVKTVLPLIPLKDRKNFHKSLIYITLNKQYFEVLYDIIESYILIYNPDIEFFEELIIEISRINYPKSIAFKNEIKLLLLSFLKRDPNKSKPYLIDLLKNNW